MDLSVDELRFLEELGLAIVHGALTRTLKEKEVWVYKAWCEAFDFSKSLSNLKNAPRDSPSLTKFARSVIKKTFETSPPKTF